MNLKRTTTIITALLILGIILGLQMNNDKTFHIMEGELMIGHDMPISDCEGESCIMLPDNGNLIQSITVQPDQIKSPTVIKVFLLAFLLLIFNIPILKKQHLSFFQIGPPDFKTTTVTLRE